MHENDNDKSTAQKIVESTGSVAKKKIFKYLTGSATATLILVVFFASLIIMMMTTANKHQTYTAVSDDELIDRFINVALAENGTVGGDKYSTWYHGHPTGLAWCSMFVSWAANEVGLIQQGIIPKEQLCYNGIQWFKARNRFQYTDHYGGNGYIPKRGDIIYFTWDSVKDPPFGHVGIVMYCEGNNVITIDGNTNNNQVAVRTRDRLSSTVLGYGTPDYASAVGVLDGSITLDGNSTAEVVWNFFISKGFTPQAAAAILGNMQQESGVNPAAIESNGQGHGICQWSYTRKQRLFQRAETAGKQWQDLEVQLSLLWDELNGLDPTTKSIMDKKYGGLENFKQSTDIAWAVEAFEKSFERAGIPRLSKRIDYANMYYNLLIVLEEDDEAA